jgi:glycerophosphoryl diester phosphodiesterase
VQVLGLQPKPMKRSSWIYPRVIAHRGGGFLAPENTLLALATGKSHGYAGVEFDVMLSRDEQPMLMHDHILDRTIRDPVFSICEPRRWVSEVDGQQLRAVDAGSWFDAELRDVKIPFFEEAIRFCSQEQIWMNIEIKPVPGYESLTGRVVAQTTAKHFPASAATDGSQPIFSSFSLEALLAAKTAAPHIPRGYLIDQPIEALPSLWEELARIDAIAIHMNHEHLLDERQRVRHELVEDIKQRGYGLFCYTINDLSTARALLEAGVDAICTDALVEMQALL